MKGFEERSTVVRWEINIWDLQEGRKKEDGVEILSYVCLQVWVSWETASLDGTECQKGW